MAEPADVTGLLKAWGRGDREALEQLMPLVYAELRLQARRYLRGERAGGTLQSTALVHEVYLRLTRAHDVDCRDRAHFYAIAAQIMRRILVDAARARMASKRGGDRQRVAASAVELATVGLDDVDPSRALCALDDALDGLARLQPRRARVIEMRFFAGLSVEETAALLDVSPQTVMRDWRLAKVWLARELGAAGADGTRPQEAVERA